MKIIISIIIFVSLTFGATQNVSLMNNIKDVIQKEEYIALAINKYIAQTGKIPKKSDNTLDWDELETPEYLGVNFNKTNPITSKEIKVIFDTNDDKKNSAYILGVIEKESEYKQEYNYLYNFYTNKVFRVNTIPPIDITKEKLVLGALVLYGDIQKQIVSVLNETNPKDIKLSNQPCNVDEYFYELNNGKLTYKFCRTDYSFDIYQEAPIYLENWEDLAYVKANIGDKAYVKKNNSWYEYYYQGDVDSDRWIPTGTGDSSTVLDNELSIEDRILSYIPDSKDLVLRKDGGCMLANGDIFCWGDNKYKRAGIETYGQLDRTLSPDYVNTPVMLKVDIEDSTQKSKKWYNNPYRVKFEKMAMNDKFVCGISPIFEYYQTGISKKYGGDLYCNGYVHSDNFYLDVTGQTTTSILRKNKIISTNKEDGVFNPESIYLKDIVMVNGTWAVLSDAGKIYTVGSNDKGALGIGSSEYSANSITPQVINTNEQVFKKIYALRDIKGFGALDNQNYFWIWGERPDGSIINKPTILSNSMRFNPDAIFVNSKEFVLKGVDNLFYRTYSNLSFKSLSTVPSTALSVTVYDYDNYEYVVYIDENMKVQGDSLFLTCKESDLLNCNANDNTIFNAAFSELNTYSSIVNNKEYASFSNISIFESKTNKIVIDYGEDYNENFESSSTTGWNVNYIHDGEEITGKFLGRLGDGRINVSSGSQTVYKTFSLGSEWANKNIKVSFDMYEIGSWDGKALSGNEDAFYVYINDALISKDTYTLDNTKDVKAGTDLGILPNSGNNNIQKHEYSYSISLDSTGSFKLGFGATLGEWGIHDGVNKKATYEVESFGINNINISKQIDNTLLSSGSYLEDFEDGNHDFWIVPPGPVPYTTSSSEFYEYPIYTDTNGDGTKFLGRFGKKSHGGVIYHGNNTGTEEVYKIFSFGAENANKEVQINYDFYRIDDWSKNDDFFYVFINEMKTQKNVSNVSDGVNLKKISDTSNKQDYSFTFTDKAYLDEFGNIRLGFGASLKYNYIETVSWGIDNIKFTLTGNTNGSGNGSGSSSSTQEVGTPYICSMTGIGSASQMYCWGNVGRSIPILSTSLYDVSKISTINKLFISQEGDKTTQMSFDKYNNDGNLFLKYPTYIGGFDYPFYFK